MVYICVSDFGLYTQKCNPYMCNVCLLTHIVWSLTAWESARLLWFGAIFNLVSVRVRYMACVWRVGCVCGWRLSMHPPFVKCVEGVCIEWKRYVASICAVLCCAMHVLVHRYRCKCNVILQAKIIFIRCRLFLRSSVNWMDGRTLYSESGKNT